MVIATLQSLTASRYFSECIKRLELYGFGVDQFFTLYIRSGGDVNSRNSLEKTALFSAVQHGNVKVVDALIKLKADPRIKTYNHTPLTFAALLGNAEIVASILRSPIISVNERISSYTPLHIAAIYGRTEVIKELLKHPEIDVNARCNTFVSQCDYNIELFLSENFAKFTERYKRKLKIENGGNDLTALHCAFYYGNVEVIKLLLKHPKTDLYAVDEDGRDALEYLTLYYDNKKVHHSYGDRKPHYNYGDKKPYYQDGKRLFFEKCPEVCSKRNVYIKSLFVIVCIITLFTLMVACSTPLKVASTVIIAVGIIFYITINCGNKHDKINQIDHDTQQKNQYIKDQYTKKNAELKELIQQAKIEQEERKFQIVELFEEALRRAGIHPDTVLQSVNVSQDDARVNINLNITLINN